MTIDRNFDSNSECKMEAKSLTCTLNMPPALESKKDADGNEISQSLPPYKRRSAFKVDEYPACPSNWMHGSEKAGSYFVPVQAGEGMWLDFNGCNASEYDVAIVPSIQGINPITGKKQDQMRLEQYSGKCPIHDEDFQQDRFCTECNFKWPAQNYLTTTTTTAGQFWLDGFRTPDGKVLQYLFTEDELKGIASQVIGEQRAFAIGIAFFLSKKEKPPQPQNVMRGMASGGSYATDGIKKDFLIAQSQDNMFYGTAGYVADVSTSGVSPLIHSVTNSMGPGAVNISCSTNENYSCDDIKTLSPAESQAKRKRHASIKRGINLHDAKTKGNGGYEETSAGVFNVDVNLSDVGEVELTQKFEIGAGASILQSIAADNKELDHYQDSPEAFIYINYVSEEDAHKILAAGKRKEQKQGYLDSLKTGN